MQDYKENNFKIGSNGFSGENNGKVYQNDNRKNCNNNININKYEYKEVSEEEIQRRKEKQESERYGLIVNLGNIIKCTGILTDHVSVSREDNIARYTVLNVVNKDTNEFLSDHLQIDFEEVCCSINKKYRIGKLCMIEFMGRVTKYGKGNDRIAVDVTTNNKFYVKRIDKSYTRANPKSYPTNISSIQRSIVDMKLKDKEDYQLMRIINTIREWINDLTRPNNIPDDYIYNYLIHQYLLNKHHNDIYLGELPNYRLNVNHYIDIIHMLNYIYIGLSAVDSSDIITILQSVSIVLCSFMGLNKEKVYKESNGITQFAIKMGLTEKEKYKVVDIIDHMIKDFKLQNVPLVEKDFVIKSSHKFIYDYRELFNIEIIGNY